MTKEKKQTLVLGSLVAVIAAVGAFQFLGGKPNPDANAGATKDKAGNEETLVAKHEETVDPTQYVIDTLIANATTPRDPFQPQAVVIDEPPGQQGDPEPPRHVVNPYDPDGATRPNTEIRGTFNGGGNNGTGTGTTVEPLDPNVPDSMKARPFALRGVMIGSSKKLCMIELADGRQTLIAEGQSFGPNNESTVVSITQDKVVLRHRGQEETLPLHGGN